VTLESRALAEASGISAAGVAALSRTCRTVDGTSGSSIKMETGVALPTVQSSPLRPGKKQCQA